MWNNSTTQSKIHNLPPQDMTITSNAKFNQNILRKYNYLIKNKNYKKNHIYTLVLEAMINRLTEFAACLTAN